MDDLIWNRELVEPGLGALLSAFPNRDELTMFLDFRFSLRLGDLVGDGKGLRITVYKLIEHFQSRGEMPMLLMAAATEKPKNPDLQALFLKLRSRPAAIAENLERTVKPLVPEVDAVGFASKMLRNVPRIAQVSIPVGDGTMYGTGFLVGPDLLLTNYHVMVEVILGNVSPTDVRITYDHREAPAGRMLQKQEIGLAENWNLSFSELAPSDTGIGPSEPTVDQLDYALVRLAEAIGDQVLADSGSKRGWINLRPEPATWAPKMPLFILQHPMPRGGVPGRPVSAGIDMEATTELNASETRVKHSVNTEHGSSGSPLFNHHWQCVGLHHAGDPNFNSVLNQAVPIDMVAVHVRNASITLAPSSD